MNDTPSGNRAPATDEMPPRARPTVIATPRAMALFPGWGVRI
jgi:hypothetical protein